MAKLQGKVDLMSEENRLCREMIGERLKASRFLEDDSAHSMLRQSRVSEHSGYPLSLE